MKTLLLVLIVALASCGPQPAPTSLAQAPGPYDRQPAPLSDRGLANLRALAVALGRVRYFHPSDEAANADWDSLTIAAVERVEGAETPQALGQALQDVLGPVAPSMAIGPAPLAPPAGSVQIAWRHQGLQTSFSSIYRSERTPAPEGLTTGPLDLGEGVVLHLPLTVWRQPDGRTWPQADRPPLRPARPEGQSYSAFDRTTRLAGVILAWSALAEFYPYFDVVDVDWDAVLDEALQRAAVDETPDAFADTLRGLTAALQDGHARVSGPGPGQGLAPVALDHVEGQVVVVWTADGSGGLQVGDVVILVEGAPVEAALAREEALVSGSPQWKRYRALMNLLSAPRGEQVSLTAERSDGSRFEVQVRPQPTATPPLREPRPPPLTQMDDGLLYVDLTRLDEAALEAAKPQIQSAAGVIFDLRGYPQGDPWYLARLSDRTVRSAPFDVPTYSRPGQEGVTWQSHPWVMPPEMPRIERAVFITDETAVSFAESALGLVAGEQLAPIVGGPTAGANGNMNVMELPGGYHIVWTGMRGTRHDGGQHHIVGVQPTVPQARTLAGIRAGRDELLERAVETLGAGD